MCNFPCAVLQFMLLGKIMSCFIVRVAMILPMNVDHFEVAPQTESVVYVSNCITGLF